MRRGEVVGWRHDVWSNGHTSRARPRQDADPARRAYLERPFAPIPVDQPAGRRRRRRRAQRRSGLRFPGAARSPATASLTMPVRASALRALGAFANVFAIESFVDEIAAARGDDPVACRLRHLADPRARAVIEAAAGAPAGADAARRDGHRPRHRRSRATRAAGAYCAVIAEVEAEREIRVRRLVHRRRCRRGHQPRRRRQPDRGRRHPGDELDAEGGGALRPRARHQRLWEAYPILRFSEVPAVEVVIVPHRRGARRSAPARRRRGRPPRPSPTPCPTRSASGCATCRSRRSGSSRPWSGTTRHEVRDVILKILSGGAAQGLVHALAPAFKAETGCDIDGTFGAVGAMREKLLGGAPADLVILTQGAGEGARGRRAASMPGFGHRHRRRADRDCGAASAIQSPPIGDAAAVRAALLAADGIYVPDLKLSTAGIHFAGMLETLGIRAAGGQASARLPERQHRDARARLGGRPADRLHAGDGDPQHAGCHARRAAAQGAGAGDGLHRRHLPALRPADLARRFAARLAGASAERARFGFSDS